MGVVLDPEETETHVIHELVDFVDSEVVEVGCGDGRLTRRIANQARSVLALDPDASAIEQARVNTPDALLPRVTFQVADITAIELPRAAFDVALLSWSLC